MRKEVGERVSGAHRVFLHVAEQGRCLLWGRLLITGRHNAQLQHTLEALCIGKLPQAAGCGPAGAEPRRQGGAVGATPWAAETAWHGRSAAVLGRDAALLGLPSRDWT